MVVLIAVIGVRDKSPVEGEPGFSGYLVPHSSDEHQTRRYSALEDT